MRPDTKIDLSQTALKARTLLDEFKAFAFKGSVVDLTIGVVVGGAFHKIIDSLVTNLIMPLIDALLPGEKPYTHWRFTIAGSTVHIGQLLGDVAHFIIISAVMFFFMVKFLGWLLHTKKEEKEAMPELTKDQELLAEIRDLLRERASAQPGGGGG